MRRSIFHRFRTVLTAILAVGSLSQFAAAGVTYQIDFEGAWSSASHPGAYPGNSAHFSRLVGAVHNDAVTFWELGELASAGIERVAEIGATGTLLSEVQVAIDAGSATSQLLGSSLFSLPNNTSFTFTAETTHPLVTLVTMVAPSPDWFVGVSSLPLREDGQWLGRVERDLVAYDAGTEEGTGFSLSNPATLPPKPIQKISSGPLVGKPPLGTFVFTVLPNELPGDFNLDGVVDQLDRQSWEVGFDNFPDGGALVVDGDANSDGYVSGADFLLWQKHFGQSLADATATLTVPEPRSLLLGLVGFTFCVAMQFSRRLFVRPIDDAQAMVPST